MVNIALFFLCLQFSHSILKMYMKYFLHKNLRFLKNILHYCNLIIKFYTVYLESERGW